MSSTPMFDAYVATRTLVDEFEGLTAEQVRNLPAAEYGRMTGRSLRPVAASNPVTLPRTPAKRESVPVAVVEPPMATPEPVSVKDMSNEEYAALRTQLGIGQSHQYGRGIFDSVSSRSEAYKNAAHAQAGRTAMVTANVVPSPAIDRPNLVGVDRPNLDTRPLADRFGTASNSYRYEG
jgi:hypothetical protein